MEKGKCFLICCPHCGSEKFDINVPIPGLRPGNWQDNVMGSANCSDCRTDFAVAIPPKLVFWMKRFIRSNPKHPFF